MEPFEANPANRRTASPAALECLRRGGAVVAANARAARSVRKAYGEAQRAAGRLAWPTPQVHDWESWLSILWQRHQQETPDAPLLLAPLQERAVWKAIVDGKPGRAEAMAMMAAEAWRLLGDFRAYDRFWRSSRGRETAVETFREWAEAFDRECRKRRWFSRAELSAQLAESIQRGTVVAPSEILFHGFDLLRPSQRLLIEAARKAGSEVSVSTAAGFGPTEAAPQLIVAVDLRDEVATCAWWGRRILEARPEARIAVIVQDAAGARGEIERCFTRILTPQSTGIEAHRDMPFEFSLGKPLAAIPVINAALLLLRWLIEPLDQAAISWLTMSGFLAADGDHPAEMAMFDAEIRKNGKIPAETPLEVFAEYRSSVNSKAVQRFLRRLGDLRHSSRGVVGGQGKGFPEWIDFAGALLRQMAWPGSRVLDTTEYQALQRWERLSGDVAGLGFDGRRVTYREFVTAIDLYAGEAIFAPESHDAPIQIMGAFESSGQEFDAAWFLGVDDRQWPSAAQLNPLLPRAMQRDLGMPHANLDTDWRLALEVTRRIAANAGECIFSHAQRDDAGELRASALLTEAFGQALPVTSSDQFRMHLRVVELAHRQRAMVIEDDSSIAWPRELEAGGAGILKDQSACAFRSFAKRRLGADDLESAERGLSPRERGDLLHQVLEALWSPDNPEESRLQTRDDLSNAIAGGRLAEILRGRIQTVFERETGKLAGSSWSREYRGAEQERLHLQLSQWLESESKREPFTVAALEQEIQPQINGLRLKLRVDRIDRVKGGQLILDYKTGKVSPAVWEGDRPDDPQLPIYGVYGRIDDLRGVLFAQIRAGDLKFAGRVENARETLLHDLKANADLVQHPLNEDLLGAWSDALSNLADQFLAGASAVVPKSYPKTCKYCGLRGLCRVSETPVILEIEDDPDFASDGEDSGLEDEADD